LAIIIPNVVPTMTCASASKRAANATVASCVLSPISARKKATNAVTKAPDLRIVGEPSSASGCSAQSPKAMKDKPTIQVNGVSGTRPASKFPVQAEAV